MSLRLSLHEVTAIHFVDVTHDDKTWGRLVVTSTNYLGKPETVEISVFPADPHTPLRVNRPAHAKADL